MPPVDRYPAALRQQARSVAEKLIETAASLRVFADVPSPAMAITSMQDMAASTQRIAELGKAMTVEAERQVAAIFEEIQPAGEA